MMLAAHALGVSSLFTTFFGLCAAEVKQLLHVPPRMFLEAAVFLGYGDEPLGQPRRKPLEEVVHLNDWEVPLPAMTTIPRIVSADDHVVEPPDVFTSRLPAKYRDVGPRVVRAPVAEMTFRGGKFAYADGRQGDDGPLADWWLYEDLQWPAHPPVARARASRPKTCRSCR